MFTGIIETCAEVLAVATETPGVRLTIAAPGVDAGARLGDSVALNGCCLTVVEIDGDRLAFQAGAETLSRTNLGLLKPGDRLNVERSLALGDRLGGHFVTGHIDGRATLDARTDEGDWSKFWFRTPRDLLRHIVSKGSIAVDGVSLTVVDAEPDRFSVALIPHTLSVTTLGRLTIGAPVNIETDLLAKYIEKLVTLKSLATSH